MADKKKKEKISGKSKQDKSEIKRLYRSKIEKKISGVCGGIAEYFNTDPVWIRIIFVLLLFLNGIGLLAYVLAWIMIPRDPRQAETEKTEWEKAVDDVKKDKNRKAEAEKVADLPRKSHGHILLGSIVILFGIAFLLKNMFNWFNFNLVWPSILILIGLSLIVKAIEREK